jgi:predicted enzyme related to lactoylglutathione lyase
MSGQMSSRPVCFPRAGPVAYWHESLKATQWEDPMTEMPQLKLSGIVLDAPDARELAAFYRRLLGWAADQDEPEWVTLVSPSGGAGLSFQSNSAYVRPVWPAPRGAQQPMMHLDIAVQDLDAATAHAKAAGAVLAGYQPQVDVRVHLDPAGHPFCLFLAS